MDGDEDFGLEHVVELLHTRRQVHRVAQHGEPAKPCNYNGTNDVAHAAAQMGLSSAIGVRLVSVSAPRENARHLASDSLHSGK